MKWRIVEVRPGRGSNASSNSFGLGRVDHFRLVRHIHHLKQQRKRLMIGMLSKHSRRKLFMKKASATINPPSPHPTEQLSSLLTREETPGSFQDADFLDLVQWLAHPVNADDDKSSTSEILLGQEFVACLTRLDQRMSSLMEMLVAMTGQMQAMAANQKKMYGMILHIINEMADDGDEDEPRTYMDGSPV